MPPGANMADLRAFRMTEIAKNYAKTWVNPGDVVLDATFGNGWDTRLLAELVGKEGRVYAFDVQEDAIKNGREAFRGQDQVTLIHDSHSNLNAHIQESLDFAMFNLGFLPGGSKECTTTAETTCKAILAALKKLKVKGAMTLCVYPGHEEGQKESFLLEQFFIQYPPRDLFVLKSSMVNDEKSPYCLLVVKKKDGSFESRD